jgi:hypothetical protein
MEARQSDVHFTPLERSDLRSVKSSLVRKLIVRESPL